MMSDKHIYALELRNVSRRYGKIEAVRDLSFSIREGESFGLLGPNGAGKTSTIMMILGLLQPDSGTVHLFGEQIAPKRGDIRRRIGMVPEQHPVGTGRWMTGVDYLDFFASYYGVTFPLRRLKELLARLDLEQAVSRPVSGYSKGMRQRLSLCRALLHDPDLLILDEPASGMDPNGIRTIRDIIVEYHRRGKTLIISSHLLSEVEKTCDRIGVLDRGLLVMEESMREISTKLDGRARIELEVDVWHESPRTVERRLRSLDYVLSAIVEGRRLELTLSPGEENVKRCVKAVIDTGSIPLRIEHISRSLEDLFLDLTRSAVGTTAGKDTPV
jgi:ABC-2 type transport system ATP-binding protein